MSLRRLPPFARPLALVGAALLSLVATPKVQAFELLGASWTNLPVPFWINPTFPEARSGTEAQQIAILRCAADAWRDQTRADFRFEYRGQTTATPLNDTDNRNTVGWVDGDGGDALAVTMLRGIGSRAVSFDIVFFDVARGNSVQWNGPQDPPEGTFDIGGVAVHEFGHALGLDHTDLREATMFPEALGRGLGLRTLHPDDLDGLDFMYGETEREIEVEISAVRPANGPPEGGNELVLLGRNFTWTEDSALTIGGMVLAPETYEVEHCGLIRIPSLPAGEGAVDVVLRNELGRAVLERGYRYGAPPPQIDSIEPSLGPIGGGTRVVVRGSRLDEGAVISIGRRELVDLVVEDEGHVTGLTPAGLNSGSADVILAQDGESDTLAGAFTYSADLLALGEGSGSPGSSDVSVPVFASSESELKGFSFAFTYDASVFRVSDVDASGVAGAAEFASANVNNSAEVTTFGLIMNFLQDDPRIPAGNDQEVAAILGEVPEGAEAGSTTDLTILREGGTPPISLIFNPVGGAPAIEPLRSHGSVRVSAGRRFLRGDNDESGEINITDAVFHLAFLFRGGDAPACDDATDVNDDGNADISDAIYTLTFLFLGGPPPEAPWPEPGIDPTEDELTCSP